MESHYRDQVLYGHPQITARRIAKAVRDLAPADGEPGEDK